MDSTSILAPAPPHAIGRWISRALRGQSGPMLGHVSFYCPSTSWTALFPVGISGAICFYLFRKNIDITPRLLT
jgi:hypothetical protein